MFESLQSGFGRHALADVILLGAIAGAVGFWVVSYGLSYGAESLSHGLLPGLVAAALIGAPRGGAGFWVVSSGPSSGAGPLSHGLLPGLVAAALIGAPLVSGALAGAIVTALLIAAAARDERIGFEVATAVAVTAMLG